MNPVPDVLAPSCMTKMSKLLMPSMSSEGLTFVTFSGFRNLSIGIMYFDMVDIQYFSGFNMNKNCKLIVKKKAWKTTVNSKVSFKTRWHLYQRQDRWRYRTTVLQIPTYLLGCRYSVPIQYTTKLSIVITNIKGCQERCCGSVYEQAFENWKLDKNRNEVFYAWSLNWIKSVLKMTRENIELLNLKGKKILVACWLLITLPFSIQICIRGGLNVKTATNQCFGSGIQCFLPPGTRIRHGKIRIRDPGSRSRTYFRELAKTF